MKIAILSPVAWRTPPLHYGPWEQMASNVAEGLVQLGWDVTLFATSNSSTAGALKSICPEGYEENRDLDAKVMECMHISYLMEQAEDYAIIHNHFDFLPLTYSRLIRTPMVTTIHGFSSRKIVPVYKRYNDIGHYVSISDADRSAELQYAATVYNGIDPDAFTFCDAPEDYLVFLGRFHPDKGAADAIAIAKAAGLPLYMAGIIQDEAYYKERVEPHIDGDMVRYLGSVGPKDRNSLLGNALALLHPIHFEEPFGLSVAEAMMCGTPVIAYRRGSMPELIRDGQTGFLTGNVGQAAERVADLRRINRSACREWSMARFSVQRMVRDYVGVYEKVLMKTTTPP
ncbi:glycosyltransferase family 4 protein [Chitinophaga lutea]